MSKSVDIYRVYRKDGINVDVEILLNNDIWRVPKAEVAKKLIDGLNKGLILGQFLTNPFTKAEFIKRTVTDVEI